ncbi:MAG: hypothetical protein ACM30G_07250 [Micromonosporaceae bacterium]
MSDVDRYLDGMFDRLSGTGAAGRRALTEVEDHLRSATEERTARNIPLPQAEHEAVTRFGNAAAVARQIRRAHRARLFRPFVSTVSLALSLGLFVCGVSVLVATIVDAALSGRSFSGGNSVVATGLLLLGAGGLAARRFAIRRGSLTPSGALAQWIVVSFFGVSALVLYLSPPLTGYPRVDGLLGFRQGPGMRLTLIVSMAAFVTSILLATRRRRPPMTSPRISP